MALAIGKAMSPAAKTPGTDVCCMESTWTQGRVGPSVIAQPICSGISHARCDRVDTYQGSQGAGFTTGQARCLEDGQGIAREHAQGLIRKFVAVAVGAMQDALPQRSSRPGSGGS